LENPKTYQPAREKNKQEKIRKFTVFDISMVKD
jgi:hypothetical protein